MIRQAIERSLTRIERKLTTDLWVSDLGHHPYKAMNRVINGEMTEFPLDVRVKMEFGNMLEAGTVAALAQNVSAPVIPQFPLYNDIWAGYADLVIDHLSDRTTILELKSTGDKWWDYKGALPRSTHVCQLWMYGQLYEEAYDIKPRLILYYQSWGHYAEFEITEDARGIVAEGMMDDKPVLRRRTISPLLLRNELEHCYQAGKLPIATDEEIDTWIYAEEAYTRLLLWDEGQE